MASAPRVVRFFRLTLALLGWSASVLVLLLAIISLAGLLLSQVEWIQRRAGTALSDWLASQYDVKISVEGVSLSFPLGVTLRNTVAYDLQGDTLISAARLTTRLRSLRLGDTIRLHFGETAWRSGQMRMVTDSLGGNRFKEFLSRFKREKRPKGPKKRRGFELRISDIAVENVRYVLQRGESEDRSGRMNYRHLDLSRIHGRVRSLRVVGDSVGMTIEGLRCHERSGIYFEGVFCDLSVSGKGLLFDELWVVTRRSSLHLPRLHFVYSGWENLSHFVDSVRIEGEVSRSILHSGTLSHFVPLPEASGIPVIISGRVHGPVSDFRVQDLRVEAGDSTRLRLNAEFRGLPEVHSTIISVDFSRLESSLDDVGHLLNGIGGRPLRVPARMGHLGALSYRGNLMGFLDNFVAYGTLRTGVGDLDLDLGLEYDAQRHLRFKGRVHASDLNARRLLGDSLLGMVSGHVQVDGQMADGEFRTEIEANLEGIEVRSHRYNRVSFQGEATNRSFAGSLSVQDTALRMRFEGAIDLAERQLPYFRFGARVDHADLHAMGFSVSDSTREISATVDVDFQGSRLDDLDGSLVIDALRFRHAGGELLASDVRLEATPHGTSRTLRLESPFLRASVQGSGRYDALWSRLRGLLGRHLPFIPPGGEGVPQEGDTEAADALAYTGEFSLDSVGPLLDLFLPGVHVSRGTRGEFHYGEGMEGFRAWIASDSLSGMGVRGSGVRVRVGLDDSSCVMDARADRAWWRDRGVVDARCQGSIRSGRYNLGVRILDSVGSSARNGITLGLSGETGRIANGGRLYVTARTDSSSLLVEGSRWLLSRARLRLDSAGFHVSNCHLTSGAQRVTLMGHLALGGGEDSLHAQLTSVDLRALTPFTRGVSLRGTLSGSLRLGYGGPQRGMGFLGDVRMNDLRVNDLYVGHLRARALWTSATAPIALWAENTALDGHIDLNARATLHRDGAEGSLGRVEGTLHLDGFDLSSLTALTGSGILPRGRVGGTLSAKGRIGGGVDLRGALECDRAGVYARDLNGTFVSSSRIRFMGARALLEGFRLEDAQGGEVVLDGEIDFAQLKDPRCDLRVSAREFHLLNTNTFGGGIYYGHMAAGLQGRAWGSLSNLRVELQLRALPMTNLTVQLREGVEAQVNRHLIFSAGEDLTGADSARARRQPAEGQVAEKRGLQLGRNLHLDMQVDVSNESQLTLVLNPRTGDMIRARGSGRLRMNTDPFRGKLLLFGDYTLDRGEFQFTLEGLISKRFRIATGSSIRFAGEASQAYADIETVYGTRASLDRLIGSGAEEKFKRRIPVDCKLFLRGPLSAPKLSFGIDVPQADAETRSQLMASLNTEEKKMRQFASLLLINSFIADSRVQRQVAASDPGSPGGEVAGATGVTGQEVLLSSVGEVVSNQFNSWLDQIGQSAGGPMINLGFNYRPSAYDAQHDEAEVSLSMQWRSFNVDANWEVNRHNTSNAVAGDISITKRSTWSENLQYKGFARSNDDLIFRNLRPFTAGGGVVYSDSFSDWGEFWGKILRAFRGK